MKSNRILKSLVLGALPPVLFLADVSPEAPSRLSFVREAHAIIGVPFSPVSVAGVARRTTRRVVVAESAAVGATAAATSQQQAATAQQQAATAQQQQATAAQQQAHASAPAVGTVVNALPAGCVQEAKGGVEYQKCGNVYYRTAFQGNNLVYVVQQP
jgi:hypothetical protein